MNVARTLALAVVAGAGAAANAMLHGTHKGEIIEMLPRADLDGTCAKLPKLCTGAVELYGHATTLTYLCPEISKTREPSTVHVTVTTTRTVTPTAIDQGPADTTIISVVTLTASVPWPAPAFPTLEPDTTTTIHSTVTKYTTITIARSSAVPSEVASLSAIPITGYISATIPSELISLPTETKDTGVTIQTSIPPSPIMTTSSPDFPTMTPPIVNGTTTGIFFTASGANSSFVQPTGFFPNSSAHYAVPTLNVENRAAEAKGAAGKLQASLASLVSLIIGMAVVACAA